MGVTCESSQRKVVQFFRLEDTRKILSSRALLLQCRSGCRLQCLPTTVRNIVATTTTTTTTSTTSTTSTTIQPETCQLTLYSKTYNRGEELVLLDDSPDLGSFSNVAISALVEGSCCWQLFGEVDFAGSSAWLRPGGVYKGTDSFGRELFQEVSSLRGCSVEYNCCCRTSDF